MDRRVIIIICIGLALGACSPGAGETSAPGGADVATPRNPFFGGWSLSQTRTAPWWTGDGAGPSPDPAFSSLRLEAAAVTGPPGIACAQPAYSTDLLSARSVFGGKLDAPAVQAPGLGLTGPDLTVLSLSCRSAPLPSEVTFVMAGPDTILLAVGDVIYTYTRQPG